MIRLWQNECKLHYKKSRGLQPPIFPGSRQNLWALSSKESVKKVYDSHTLGAPCLDNFTPYLTKCLIIAVNFLLQSLQHLLKPKLAAALVRLCTRKPSKMILRWPDRSHFDLKNKIFSGFPVLKNSITPLWIHIQK